MFGVGDMWILVGVLLVIVFMGVHVAVALGVTAVPVSARHRPSEKLVVCSTAYSPHAASGVQHACRAWTYLRERSARLAREGEENPCARGV